MESVEQREMEHFLKGLLEPFLGGNIVVVGAAQHQ